MLVSTSTRFKKSRCTVRIHEKRPSLGILRPSALRALRWPDRGRMSSHRSRCRSVAHVAETLPRHEPCATNGSRSARRRAGAQPADATRCDFHDGLAGFWCRPLDGFETGLLADFVQDHGVRAASSIFISVAGCPDTIITASARSSCRLNLPMEPS